MILRSQTIKVLSQTVCGDNGKSFYRSGTKLVDFFNELGFDDTYDSGFPTRWIYAKEKIEKLVKDGKFMDFIDKFLDEYLYLETDFDVIKIIEHINKYLKFDGYEIIKSSNRYHLKDIRGAEVVVTQKHLEVLSTEFMNEQIKKCDRKLIENDFDGAITNARSLVEEVLLEVESQIMGDRQEYDGNLNRLYTRVKRLINFDPSKREIEDSLKQVLTGLNSIICGLGELRNKTSDSHAREYKPGKHHAELAVNSAKTFTAFVISSLKYQVENNTLDIISKKEEKYA